MGLILNTHTDKSKPNKTKPKTFLTLGLGSKSLLGMILGDTVFN